MTTTKTKTQAQLDTEAIAQLNANLEAKMQEYLARGEAKALARRKFKARYDDLMANWDNKNPETTIS